MKTIYGGVVSTNVDPENVGNGVVGKDGVGIESVTQIVTSTEDNGKNIIEIKLTNGNKYQVEIENGSRGGIGPQGVSGVYVGSGEMPDGYNIQIDPNGSASDDVGTGEAGVGIESIEQTTTSTADGGENVITIELTNGVKSTFTVFNGSKGSKGDKGDKGEHGSGGVPVTKYGAKGDGSTNDITAFQNALAENRIVFVPEGTYILSGAIRIRENCMLALTQATVLKFTQTSGNCIEMQRSANIKGNHATIFVPYTFSGHVIHASTDVEDGNGNDTPPWTAWDPQWKMTRYITDINVCKPWTNGRHESADGACSGVAVYVNCERESSAGNEFEQSFMWGVNMSGLRIAGAFTYGVHLYNTGTAWNHEPRIEAIIEACETGVCLDNCNQAFVSAAVQPRPANNKAAYAKYGIKLVNSKNVDLTGCRVWDWNATNSLWTDDGEYQHIAMYGECKGLVLSDFLYYESTADIRELIYSNTQSNLEKMTILQEPITRWFKPVDRIPYFYDGSSEKELVIKDEFFNTSRVKKFTDQLSISTAADGSVYNGVGYKQGTSLDANGNEKIDAYAIATGFIPIKPGDIIYTKNISFDTPTSILAAGGNAGDWGMIYYDTNFNVKMVQKHQNIMIDNYYQYGMRTEDGLKITTKTTLQEQSAAYVRFVFHPYDFGPDPLISVNEEIKVAQEGFLADSVKIKGDSLVMLSPSGKSFAIKVDESGTLSTTEL